MSEATETEDNRNAKLPGATSASRQSPAASRSSTWLPFNREHADEGNSPLASEESAFSRTRNASHTNAFVRKKPKLVAKSSGECSSFSDIEDIDANSDKWKTFGRPYSYEQLFFLDAIAKRSSECSDNDDKSVCGSIVQRASNPRTGIALHDEALVSIPPGESRCSGSRSSASRADTDARSSLGTLSEKIAVLRRMQVPLTEAVEETPAAHEHWSASEQWPFGATADVFSNESISEGASQFEEQDLKEKIASWDPSQEDGYCLSMADGMFEIAGHEEASDPTQECTFPSSQHASDIDKSSTVLAGKLCTPRSDSSSRNNATDKNPYENLQWLTEDYDNLPLESPLHKDHMFKRNEHFYPLDTPGVIAVIDSAAEAFLPEPVSSRKAPASQPRSVVAQAAAYSGDETPLSTAASRAAPTRTEKNNEPAFFEISRELSHDVDQPDSKHREEIPVASSVVLTAANDKEESGNNDLARVDSSSCKYSGGPHDQVEAQINANDATSAPGVVSAGVRGAEVTRDLCADSNGETTKPARSVSSRKENNLARLVESLRFVDDVPGASWDIAPLTSTKGSALTAREFDSDDITVTENGDISICIRMSTRRKSAMLWPFGAASLSRPPSPPQ
ncbi:hypothetical protein V5799_013127 [Amblyomma americanum]|uniref:Uncharacterized protein n=1 Tax=Amblyomma americanum TaxID=6943 RepID=A0AAQ4E6Q9_AMBAM